ncbi:hypothetical protein HK104_011520 [Borealophlyctis nickersoniae]|nr:hypothetical protein HK104_011520 [Borealophlyctis nickersoniae]
MTFLKVDVDEHQSISKECGVRAMPTFQIYRSGSKLAEVVGADIAKVERLVRQHASSSAGGGFPATGGRVLGSGAPAPRAGAGGDWGGGYVWYVAAAALLAYLWWTKNDPSMTGEPRRV